LILFVLLLFDQGTRNCWFTISRGRSEWCVIG